MRVALLASRQGTTFKSAAVAASDITALGTPTAYIPAPSGGGNHDISIIKDGVVPAPGTINAGLQYDTFSNNQQGLVNGNIDWIGYTWSALYQFTGLTFTEGMEFGDGGWFTALQVQVRLDGVWTNVAALTSTPTYPNAANTTGFETYALSFTPVVGDGIRVYGPAGGSNHFISVGELRVSGVFSANKTSSGMGFNWPNAIVTYVNHWDQQSTTYVNRARPFQVAALNGAQVMRTFFGTIDSITQTGASVAQVTRDNTWAALGELLDTAAANGVKLILSNYLTQETIGALAGTTYGSWPLARQALTTAGSTAWNGLQTWMASCLTRFATHPGVYSWEVTNEPNYMLGIDDGSVTRDAGCSFLNTMQLYLKSHGATKVGTGGRVLYDKSQLTDAQATTATQNADYLDDHYYPDGTSAASHLSQMDTWVTRVRTLLSRPTMPVVIGEYGCDPEAFFTEITDGAVARGWTPITWGYDAWDANIFNESTKTYVLTRIGAANSALRAMTLADVPTLRGVNWYGMEDGLRGPTLAELQAFAARGYNIVRLPLAYQTADATVAAVLADAVTAKIWIGVDVHNFGRIGGTANINAVDGTVIDSSNQSTWWAKCTTQLAAFRQYASYVPLDMNEPKQTGAQWEPISIGRVAALRGAAWTGPIGVSAAKVSSAGGINNSDAHPAGWWITDTNSFLEVHHYLQPLSDATLQSRATLDAWVVSSSGQGDLTTYAQYITRAFDWGIGDAHWAGVPTLIGEFAIPPGLDTELEAFLAKVDLRGYGALEWGAGMWGTYNWKMTTAQYDILTAHS